MPRAARQRSESGYYHVILRGIGWQIMFEDDEDNERFLSTVQRYRLELGFELVAYYLMENHKKAAIRDENAREWICSHYRIASGTRLQQWDKKKRDAALRELKDVGLSVRQLERLTRINRGVIQKA